MGDSTCPNCDHPRFAHSREGCISVAGSVAGPPRGERCDCPTTFMELSPRAASRPSAPTTASGNTPEVA